MSYATAPRVPLRPRAVVVAVVCALLASVLLAVPGAQASVGTLYAKVDGSRTAAGLAPLVRDAALQKVAQGWADQLARSGTLAHNPDYASQIPSGWSRAAENVAYASGSDPDARIHTMWMQSAGHKANILGPYSSIGIGRAVDTRGQVWAVQVFATYPRSPQPLGLYSDVYPGEPYATAIAWATDRGITVGNADGSYGRQQVVTRLQMAAFLHRAAGAPAFSPPRQATFDDVPAGSPHHVAVEWLVARGIAARADSFRPSAGVTRAEMAGFLSRAVGPDPLVVPTRAVYTDVPPGAPHYAAIGWMSASGIAATAATSPRYDPWSKVTREQMAAFLHRAYT